MVRDFERLTRQDSEDARRMAYANQQFLHYSTNTPCCTDVMSCRLCTESSRLAVQYLRPRIEERVISSIMDLYNIRCDLPHPGGD